jgi:hypothetical protein
VFFESIEYGPADSAFVTFGYYLAGGRVYVPQDGHAAKVSFGSGLVDEAELNYRGYTVLTGELARLMPKEQALAAAGGEFILEYPDLGAERLEPGWYHYWFDDESAREER